MPWLALAVPLVAVTVLGLLLNGYILLVVLLTKQVHTANTLLLLHLGAVDVLLCALFLLFAAPGALGARGPTDAASSWASDSPLCSLHSFLAALLHPLALWTVCGLNCDRCAAIAAPLHYARLVSTRRAAIFILSTWVLCLTLALPPLFVPNTSIPPSTTPSFLVFNSTTTEEPDWNTTVASPSCPPVPSAAPTAPYILLLILGGCTSEWTSAGDRTQPPRIPPPPLSPWYPSAYTVFTLLFPAGLILACNIKVLTIARYHRHRIAAAIFEVTLSAQVTITHQRNPFPLTKPRAPAAGPGGWIGSGLFGNRRSALLTVVQLIGSLLLLYFPFYSVMLWHSFQSVSGERGENSGGGVPPLLLTASSALLACSPPVNGFIYGVRSKVLRRTFANYWRKQMSKSAVNQEIQARTPSTCGSRRPSLTPLGLQRRASMDACLGFPALPPPPPSAASTSSSSSAASSAGGSKCPNKPRITRVASELSWRPLGVASPIAGVATVHVPRRTRSFRDRRTTTTGLHTLQVPNLQRCESTMGCPRDVHSNSSAAPFLGRSQYFLQRVLGYYHHGRAGFGVGGHFVNSHNAHPMAGGCSGAVRRRSPRIMVTRALSQEEGKEIESEVHNNGAPERRLSSSTTTLLERRMSREQAFSSGDSPEEDSAADGRIVRWRMGSTGTDEISVSKEMNDNISGEKTGSPRLCTSLDSIPVRGGGEEPYEGQAGPPAEDEGRQGRRRVLEESGVRAGIPRQQQDGQRVNRAALKRIRFGIGDPVHHSWPSRTRGGVAGDEEVCTLDGGSETNESDEARAEA